MATINPLFPGDISLEKIQQIVEIYPDLTVRLSFQEWKQKIAPIFRLNEIQTQVIYTTLTIFLTRDPGGALFQAQSYLVKPTCLHSFSMRVTDMMVLLFAVFIKKKFRLVGQRSSFEAYPSQSKPMDSNVRLSARTSNSDLNIRPKLLELMQVGFENNSEYSAIVQFFILKLPGFLKIYAKDGLTRHHVISLGLLIHGGPSYTVRSDNLVHALHLFREKDIESPDTFKRTITTLLPKKSESDSEERKGPVVPSPAAYRPLVDRLSSESRVPPHSQHDEPFFINNKLCEGGFGAFDVKRYCDVYVDSLKNRTTYICSAVSAVFITHCKDSFVFIGAANVIHIEYCANCRIICAARMVHIDSSVRCTTYLLVNTKPLVTGGCPGLVLAPYNALYRKLSLDLMCIGISPAINLWDQPVMLGLLGSHQPEKMLPSSWTLTCIPFAWNDVEPVVNAVPPPEYVHQLEMKRNMIMNLKHYVQVIQTKDPSLAEKIVEQLKNYATKNMQLNEFTWLANMEQQQEQLALMKEQGQAPQ